ncbi:YdcF family protein [Tessaracoccus sp. OS52]|uniref:SanA/YdcF family protein n=1 Tax=Tessaracoccus sp. OS52 TaxID=2886691 RepID=UPI001D10A4A2|nr:ElyC/SanA/YdcF family protein [Tessaracoccus sp. OS52]MCC2594235.1 YdcF family protein [Tessaracoccus sp. OS52]
MRDGRAKAQPRRRWRWVRVLAIAGLVAGTALAGMVVHGSRHTAAGAQGRVHTVADVPATPVAMVLGALAHPDGRPSSFLAARLDLAVELWERDTIRAVLVSGDGSAAGNHQTDVMRDYLTRRGVPADRIVTDPAGFDTYDSCVRARDVYGVEQLVIVSQEYHLARALTICREIGIDAVGVGDVSVSERHPVAYSRGQVREQFANLKMEWDLFTNRRPQQDPVDPALRAAAGLEG